MLKSDFELLVMKTRSGKLAFDYLRASATLGLPSTGFASSMKFPAAILSALVDASQRGERDSDAYFSEPAQGG